MSRRADAEKANSELIASLKFKVKDLEHEVSTLRGRLDGLRKAKNTTITKKETEVVEVGFKKDPRYEAKLAELERQLREVEGRKLKDMEDLKARIKELEKQIQERDGGKYREIEEMRRKHAAELAEALKQRQKIERDMEALRKRLQQDMKGMELQLEQHSKPSNCGHEDEMRKMKIKISNLEADNSALMVGNSELSEKVNSLVHDLSVKEAQWCEMEEKYKLKLKQNWGDKYGDWMAETEKKIQELQDTNNLLDPRYEAKLAELERQLREVEGRKLKDMEDLKARIKELEKQIQERDGGKYREIEEMRRKHAAELAEALKQRQKIERDMEALRKRLQQDMKGMELQLEQHSKPSNCGHEDEMRKMKIKISNLEADNSALMVGNSELSEKVNSLVHDLSVKEAQWCEMEEKYKLKLKQNWGDKYGDWMAETEKKIQELQDTNNLLRTYLHRSGMNLPPNV